MICPVRKVEERKNKEVAAYAVASFFNAYVAGYDCMGLFTSPFSLLSYVGPLLINSLLQLMSVFETVNLFTEVFYEDIKEAFVAVCLGL